MSDRIDTEAVRAAIDKWQIDTHWWGDPLPSESIAAAVVAALCDEVDRLRAALRQSRQRMTWEEYVEWRADADALLGEQEAPEPHADWEKHAQVALEAMADAAAPPVERCPNRCENGWLTDSSWIRPMRCRHPWHSDLGAEER